MAIHTYVYRTCSRGQIEDMRDIPIMRDIHILYTALTRRDKGVLDCIALDEVAQYAVRTLNDVSVKSLHIAHSTDCHSVLCITLD